ncbi:hypothetical protein AAW50_01925 [Mycoplasmopsis canis]|uniref:hypothetical protein n=1 Tax=Mycoplasmopsis canis TaxID=29555 RepID=UPI0006249FB3|nr:hypothetical protein [Mycoplasmopsis canis]AKF41176.1 hypothetical protein AAW50_01925 [Mycoplasmopsis canis]
MKIYKKIFLSLPIVLTPVGIVACAKPEQPGDQPKPGAQTEQPEQPGDQPKPGAQTEQPEQPGDQPKPGTQTEQPVQPVDQPKPGAQTEQPEQPGDQPKPGSQTEQPEQPGDQPKQSETQPSAENNQLSDEEKKLIELPQPRELNERTKNSAIRKIAISGVALSNGDEFNFPGDDEVSIKFRYSVILKEDESNPVIVETPGNLGLQSIVKIDSDGNLIFSPSKKPELRPPLLSSYKDNNKVVKEVKEYTITHIQIKNKWLEIKEAKKIVIEDFLNSSLKIVDTYKKDNKLYIEFNDDLSKFKQLNFTSWLVNKGGKYDPFVGRIPEINTIKEVRTKKDQEINFNILEIDLTQDFRNKNNGKDVLLLNITLSNDDSTYNFDLKRASRTDVVVEL